MAALHSRWGHYIFVLWFLSFFLLFCSSPNLNGRTLDVYHTSTHGVALVRISNAGLKCAARGSLEMQDARNRQKFAIWVPSHNFVGLYRAYIFATTARIGNRKNLLNSNVSPTCPYNMVNFGPLAAKIVSLVWGTPTNVNCFASWQRYYTAL